MSEGTKAVPRLDTDRLLDDPRTRIIVCCGSGGVGKTTTAAALGLRAAERGRHVVVLTVDPARRLAQSMGLSSLDNTPRPVPLSDDAAAGGTLHAMMLDMKRTFDEIVEAHADPDRAGQILANPFYQSLSSSFAGTQEYMAMEKLGQLRRTERWDLIVVDTPPSRSALDFLDAPQRLSRFLDGRLIRLLTAPTRAGGRAYLKVVNVGFSVFTGIVTKVLGAQVLRDVQTFVAAFDTMFGGFRERAEDTYRLLQTPGTAFLVVATPGAGRAAGGVVLRGAAVGGPDAAGGADPQPRAPFPGCAAVGGTEPGRRRGPAARGRPGGQRALSGFERRRRTAGRRDAVPARAAALRLHAERMQLIAAERRLAQRFTAAHPAVPVARVIAQPEDVHDLAGPESDRPKPQRQLARRASPADVLGGLFNWRRAGLSSAVRS